MPLATPSETFTACCSDLPVSANNINALFGFSAIVITAWNSSGKTVDGRARDTTAGMSPVTVKIATRKR